MPFDRKKELEELEGQGPMPFGEEAGAEEEMDLEEMEMPTEEGAEAPAYSADEIKELYDADEAFAAEVNPIAAKYMEDQSESAEEYAEEEEMPEEEEEDLFA